MLTYPTFEALTIPVEHTTLAHTPAPSAPDLPRLTEPAQQPTVAPATARPGRLAEAAIGDRVIDLAAYAWAGLPGGVPVSLVRPEVAERIAAAADLLPDGYGLAIFDAWRPLPVQRALYESAYTDPTLPTGFVSPPSTEASTPPPHLTGGTVDLTLTWEGAPLGLGTGFDDFTPLAHTAAFENQPGTVRDHRRLLFHAMSQVGFIVIECEWWHFEFGTRRWAALTGNQPLYGPMAVEAEPQAA